MASAEPVVVVAHWTTTEDAMPEVLEHLDVLRSTSLTEPGCVGYEAFRSLSEPTTLLLVEHYRDDAALDAHLNSAHYRDVVVERIRPLLTDRRVEFLRTRDAT
ncbi:putative quinol monooxygenase [Mycolicibacterium sp. 050158]|uniref:putative quinol monooxygenase n=1 Tax=Mycolicibacterium sp. 050158 TaxID=3090602 RepID=UPI00299EC98B|nr:putative quinol monooxygenase [Mycolicibacterium sp. 050158]MDX1890261.1 putative quinol monooxygenase [Mycolicibacterium sp. 050158]